MMVVYTLLLIYIWPLKIDVDAENPAPWNWVCSCKYWSSRRENDG